MLIANVMFSQGNWGNVTKLYKQLKYQDAILEYEKVEKKNKKKEVPPAEVLQIVGDSYQQLGKYREASQVFGNLHQLQKNEMSDEYYRKYDQSLRASGFYKDANRLTKERLLAKNDKGETDRFAKFIKELDSLEGKKSLYTIKNIENNTKNSDFGVMFYGNKVVYSSTKDTVSKKQLYGMNKQPYLVMYQAEMNHSTGNFSNETKFFPEIQNKYHNATPSFSPDFKTVYFSNNPVNKRKLVLDDTRTNNIQIFRVAIQDEKPGKPEELYFADKSYSSGHPAVSTDGKYLYFSSEMPGGKGETDLYRVEIFGDASFGKVENLGDQINTSGREMFPFVQGDMLYFSSDGNYGYGGLDVYKVKINRDGSFGKPTNLGKPVNSEGDDFSYIVDKNDEYGYFSSNRSGGKGDDDIYFFTKEKEKCYQEVSGIVINKKDLKPIPNAAVVFKDEFGEIVAEVQSNENGEYTTKVPCNAKVDGTASKADYEEDKRTFEAKDGKEPQKNIDFVLDRIDDYLVSDGDYKKIDINTIYFDYNKWDITPQAMLELDKVVYVMTRFPKVKIRIESHTDSRGNDAYNMKLSDNRAKSTQKYIESKGIDPSRILSAIGYGESRLKNNCGNKVKCSEADHAVNRRSDFIIEEM